jgi:hypothetical protein
MQYFTVPPIPEGIHRNGTGIELESKLENHVYLQIYVYKHLYTNVGIPILFRCHVSKGHVT